MDATACTRRGRRVACMDWFLFFSFRGRVPGMGPMGKSATLVHLITLANVIKRCSQNPIPGAGLSACSPRPGLGPWLWATAAIPHARERIHYQSLHTIVCEK